MPNTALSTTVTAGSTAHTGDHNIVHAEVNELSRATGLRDIAGLLINGWAVANPGGVRIERIRDEVSLYTRGLNGAAATNLLFLAMPSGFVPMDNSFQSALQEDAAGAPFAMRAMVDGFRAPQRDLGGYWRAFTYRTRAAWPTSLPGSAVV